MFLNAIEKAIVTSDLGVTPNNDGEVIRLILPQLTSERRKVALRNIRRDAIKCYEKLEKEKKLSEDNAKDLSSDLQKVTDEYMKKIDSLYKQEEKPREHIFSVRGAWNNEFGFSFLFFSGSFYA
ncbi:hypothetical protein ACH5RR_010663 [Cinchona calisaya]|uniref:Ribosome-recycling factor, chloroplastic n=1 Tax=Cinchona calisaya TaxID=153742 RepID=A0ABD3AJM3_9GENT